MRFKLNEFEHVWGVSLYRGDGWGSLYGGVPVRLTGPGVPVWCLYGGVQCIMGNCHMVPTMDRMADRHN